MALIPENERHRLQIAAGAIGRTRGHEFERELAQAISRGEWGNLEFRAHRNTHRIVGNPAVEVIKYIAGDLKLKHIDHVDAWWLGGLATSGLGDLLRMPNGAPIKRSKADVLVSLHSDRKQYVKGISVKTCSKKTPTNDQLYFTTASAFSELLRRNGILFSANAEKALKMFCGDMSFRPGDLIDVRQRRSDPDRWFFEELPKKGRDDIARTLTKYQAEVTRILLQLAYPEDPHPPEYVLHVTVKPEHIDKADLAIFTVDELIDLSSRYAGFETKGYIIRKGRFKGDNATHLAPRFGYIQFQRGGQKQHPTQLQFNLQAGYFDHLPNAG
jgi:hypothetical protein